MALIVFIIVQALTIYMWLVILAVLLSWLVAFGVLNTKNKMVYKFMVLLHKITDPLMKELRRIIPPVAGMDLTPIVVIFGIQIIQRLLISLVT
jgi:YggT family protein